MSRHLKELESAGLIVGKKHGREMRYELQTRPLIETAQWLQARANRWERSLARLAEYLEEDSWTAGTGTTDPQATSPGRKSQSTDRKGKEETMADYELTQERTLSVSPEVAFAAFTEPQKLTRWFTTEAHSDLRPGGRYRNADGDEGEFLIFEPPQHLRFTWDNPDHCPGTVVDVNFESLGPGKSTVRLVHHDLETKSHYDDLNEGWSWAMDSFQAYLETGHPISYDNWLGEQGR